MKSPQEQKTYTLIIKKGLKVIVFLNEFTTNTTKLFKNSCYLWKQGVPETIEWE